MSKSLKFVGFDLGAESGRAMLGQFDGERIELSDVHRFVTGPTALPDGLHWDVLRFWNEIKHSLACVAAQHGRDLAGIGLDTWGVDSALLDRNGALIGNPYHYRDNRTDGMYQEAFRRVPREEIFERTGIQFMEINTLYQVLSMAVRRSPQLDVASTLLMISDLFNYWLTGRMACEFSETTTSQCYDPRAGSWAKPMLEKLGIPTDIFVEVVPTGTTLGPLAAHVADEVGLERVPVIAPACHDTGSAVAAVPATGPG